jgi:hypothetical protein
MGNNNFYDNNITELNFDGGVDDALYIDCDFSADIDMVVNG